MSQYMTFKQVLIHYSAPYIKFEKELNPDLLSKVMFLGGIFSGQDMIP